LETVWNSLINGGKFIGKRNHYYEDIEIKYSYPNIGLDGSLTFNDL